MKNNDYGRILQAIYDEEINFSITTFWDGGFDFKLGDKQNGFKAEETFYTFAEGVHWLRSQVYIHYLIVLDDQLPLW